jgi:hypothetical protein
MLTLWVYECLNDCFGQVGYVGIMCPAIIFKVIWNYLIFGIPHYGNIHVFVHGISLHIYYGIIACWNIHKC